MHRTDSPRTTLPTRSHQRLCLGGEAKPGFEPEPDAAQQYGISEVRWFDLRDGSAWDEQLMNDPITYPQVRNIQIILGYKGGRGEEVVGE